MNGIKQLVLFIYFITALHNINISKKDKKEKRMASVSAITYVGSTWTWMH